MLSRCCAGDSGGGWRALALEVPRHAVDARATGPLNRLYRVTLHVGDHDLRPGAPIARCQAVDDLGPVLRTAGLEPLVPGGFAAHAGIAVLVGGLWLEQKRVEREHRIVELLERRDVRDPDGTPMRGRNELPITWMDLEVVHGHGRESLHEPAPRPATVQRHVDPDIRTGEQEVLVVGVFADHMKEIGSARREITRD